MQSQLVLLGLAGDYVATHEREKPTHYVTKVGGSPWFPSSKPPSLSYDLNCEVCGAQLVFVMQAHAPLYIKTHGVAHDQPDRVLLIYGCCSPNCGRLPGSWFAASCQPLPASPPPVAPQIKENNVKYQDHTEEDPFGFGAEEDPFGFGAEEDTIRGASEGTFENGSTSGQLPGSSMFDLSDLDLALEQSTAAAAIATSGIRRGKEHPSSILNGTRVSDDAAGAVCSCEGPAPASGATLPEFYLYAEEEPQGGRSTHEDRHIEHLLHKYEEEERRQSLVKRQPKVVPSTTENKGEKILVHNIHPESDEEEEEEDNESLTSSTAWAGEEYEEAQVRGVNPAYLKFAARLGRQPQQCVRYSRGGSLLWPLKAAPQLEPCGYCGADTIFEMQIMAPLISMLVEAATFGTYPSTTQKSMITSGSPVIQGPTCSHHNMNTDSQSYANSTAEAASISAVNAAANWDICSVAVFSCSRACLGSISQNNQQMGMNTLETGVNSSWIPLQLRVVNEEDCHVPVVMMQ